MRKWRGVGGSMWRIVILVFLCFQVSAERKWSSWRENEACNKSWNDKTSRVLYQWRKWPSYWGLHWAADGSRTPQTPRPPCDLRCFPPAQNTQAQINQRQFSATDNKGRLLYNTQACSSRKGQPAPFLWESNMFNKNIFKLNVPEWLFSINHTKYESVDDWRSCPPPQDTFNQQTNPNR